MSTLAEAAEQFRAAYHAREELVAEQADWNRTLALVANDTGDSVALQIVEGRIAGCSKGTTGDIVITSDARTLCEILELRQGPNTPYLFGELTVRGPEADFIRLDYVTSRLCPE